MIKLGDRADLGSLFFLYYFGIFIGIIFIDFLIQLAFFKGKGSWKSLYLTQILILLFVAIIIFPTISRTPRENHSYEDRQYNLLGDLIDNKGRLIKRAESGWIPGEDIWLKISRYDTLGNVIEEYGAKPYGKKYKETFKYDGQNRITEKCSYSYKSKKNEYSDFENYDNKWGYELKDTLVDFSVTDKQLEYKIVYTFDDKSKMTRELHYNIEFDSVTNELNELLTFDTLFILDNLDSLSEKK